MNNNNNNNNNYRFSSLQV